MFFLYMEPLQGVWAPKWIDHDQYNPLWDVLEPVQMLNQNFVFAQVMQILSKDKNFWDECDENWEYVALRIVESLNHALQLGKQNL